MHFSSCKELSIKMTSNSCCCIKFSPFLFSVLFFIIRPLGLILKLWTILYESLFECIVLGNWISFEFVPLCKGFRFAWFSHVPRWYISKCAIALVFCVRVPGFVICGIPTTLKFHILSEKLKEMSCCSRSRFTFPLSKTSDHNLSWSPDLKRENQ